MRLVKKNNNNKIIKQLNKEGQLRLVLKFPQFYLCYCGKKTSFAYSKIHKKYLGLYHSSDH